jgi:hypothetical protein
MFKRKGWSLPKCTRRYYSKLEVDGSEYLTLKVLDGSRPEAYNTNNVCPKVTAVTRSDSDHYQCVIGYFIKIESDLKFPGVKTTFSLLWYGSSLLDFSIIHIQSF